MMKLDGIGTHEVVTLEYTDSLDKAIALMEEHDIHHLPVVEDRHPVGIVSDRDLLTSVGWLLSRDRATRSLGAAHVGPLRVDEIMTTPVKVAAVGDPLEKAARLMLHESISAVPLVADSKLVGIVSETDFLQCYLDHRQFGFGTAWRFQKVSRSMSANVLTMDVSDPTSKAFRLMQRKQIRHVPVTSKEKLVGIVSDRDLRKAFMRDRIEDMGDDETQLKHIHRSELREVMSDHVQTISPFAGLVEAAARMVEFRIGALPVVDSDELLGIITETDLLRAFVAACE